MSPNINSKLKGKVVKEIHGHLARALLIQRGLKAGFKALVKGSPLYNEVSDLLARIAHQVELIKAGKKEKLELHLRLRSVAALKIMTNPKVLASLESAGVAVAVVLELENVNKSLKRPNKALKRAA